MATPSVPYKIYAISADGLRQTPVDIADFVSATPGNDFKLDSTSHKFVVVPSDFDVGGFTSEGNVVEFSYLNAAGTPVELSANIVNSNLVAFNPSLNRISFELNGVLATQTIPDWSKLVISTLVTEDNTIKLSFTDHDGVSQLVDADVIQSNIFSLNTASNILTGTLNGVSATVDLTALVESNESTVEWNDGNYVLTFTKDDGTTVQLDLSTLVAVSTTNSLTGDGTSSNPLKLVNDLSAPGNTMVYGTFADGTRGWFPKISLDADNVAKLGADGGVFAGPTIGVSAIVMEGNSLDVPLNYIGNPDLSLYAPTEFRLAMDPVTGLPLKGANNGNLVMGLWELPAPQA